MLQDQLGILKAPPDIYLDHHQMEGLASTISNRSSDSTAADPPAAARAGAPMSGRPKSAAAMATSQDQLPAPQHALKCPRCDSLNTKFCYYNNYSQAQPRHFCKSCRRYWTQGGALRNVPVGGGCRKNKRVKPRSFLNMGGMSGLLDPNSLLMDDSTSNMLAKLSNITNFGGGGGGGGVSGGGGNFGDEQLLNIAFSRFQESMRLRQQQCSELGGVDGGAGAGVPFFDMGFPSLVQRPCTPGNCTCGLCGSRSSALHPSLNNMGCTGFESHMGFSKGIERDAGVFASPFEVNPNLYDQASSVHHHSNITGTSATATLASIEDQLSNFSNLQPHQLVDPPRFDGQDEKGGANIQLGGAAGNAVERLATSSPLQLLGHGGAASSHHSSAMAGDHVLQTLGSHDHHHLSSGDEQQDEKPLINIVDDHNNWQQPTFMMSEMLQFVEAPAASHSHGHIHNWAASQYASSRWPDMHALSTTAAAAAAGAVL